MSNDTDRYRRFFEWPAHSPPFDFEVLDAWCREMGLCSCSGGFYICSDKGELLACVVANDGGAPWIFSPEGAANVAAYLKERAGRE